MKDIIIEGVDRLGKDTLIKGIQDELGFFNEIHYQKPRLLAMYQRELLHSRPSRDDTEEGFKDWVDDLSDSTPYALKKYQIESFFNMFKMLSTPELRFIMNRAHLGECVYSPRYRQYGGDYVFDIERQFTHDRGSRFTDTTLLVLLSTSDFSFIKDDGLSFDFAKKEEEQDDFKKAFAKSTIKNKLLVDVSNGAGGYRMASDILKEVIDAYKG